MAEDGVVSWEILGSHETAADDGEALIDGFDVALRLATGDVRAFGVRTGRLFTLGQPQRDEGWRDAYRPIRCDLDPATVRHWSFDDILWLGPEPKPCVVWSNADGFTRKGIATLIGLERFGAVLAGRGGVGLPSLDEAFGSARGGAAHRG